MVAISCEQTLAECEWDAGEKSSAGEFLLVCEAIPASGTVGLWRFCLETTDGETVLDVREKEFADPNRLALLAIVRGLEAIEGTACVTLVSTSRYVIRGLRDSLHRWRENDFVWEQFGRMAPIENADLWRRVDRALRFHQVNACLLSATRVSGHREVSEFGETTRGRNRRDEPTNTPGASTPGVNSGDRLRRWLFAQCSASRQSPRRRYGPADLAMA